MRDLFWTRGQLYVLDVRPGDAPEIDRIHIEREALRATGDQAIFEVLTSRESSGK